MIRVFLAIVLAFHSSTAAAEGVALNVYTLLQWRVCGAEPQGFEMANCLPSRRHFDSVNDAATAAAYYLASAYWTVRGGPKRGKMVFDPRFTYLLARTNANGTLDKNCDSPVSLENCLESLEFDGAFPLFEDGMLMPSSCRYFPEIGRRMAARVFRIPRVGRILTVDPSWGRAHQDLIEEIRPVVVVVATTEEDCCIATLDESAPGSPRRRLFLLTKFENEMPPKFSYYDLSQPLEAALKWTSVSDLKKIAVVSYYIDTR